MLRLVALFVLAASPALAQSMPTLNVAPSCRAAAAMSSPGLQQDFDACMNSENKARDEIASQWASFSAADRAGCRALVTISGSPGTYTELLTCLEMKRDARALPKEPDGTIGQSSR